MPVMMWMLLSCLHTKVSMWRGAGLCAVENPLKTDLGKALSPRSSKTRLPTRNPSVLEPQRPLLCATWQTMDSQETVRGISTRSRGFGERRSVGYL